MSLSVIRAALTLVCCAMWLTMNAQTSLTIHDAIAIEVDSAITPALLSDTSSVNKRSITFEITLYDGQQVVGVTVRSLQTPICNAIINHGRQHPYGIMLTGPSLSAEESAKSSKPAPLCNMLDLQGLSPSAPSLCFYQTNANAAPSTFREKYLINLEQYMEVRSFFVSAIKNEVVKTM